MEEMLEQPTQTTSQSVIVNKEKEMGEHELEVGSILGKFKSVEDLSQAYASLQAEFTKKSQKLSELLKRDNSPQSSGAMQNFVLQETKPEMEPKEEPQMEQKPEVKSDEPLFEQPTWKETVAQFLKQNPVAKQFASEITNLLLSDKALASQPYSLDLAFGRVLAKHYKTDGDRMNDEQFLQNFVLNNEKVKQLIFKNTLLSVQKQKTPTTMGTQSGAYLGLTPQERPNSLQEANKVLERMLKTK